jgi:polysaccharide pyruvyl transferase WcaK-like protein
VYGSFASRNMGDFACGAVLFRFLESEQRSFVCYSSNHPHPAIDDMPVRCIRPHNLISRLAEIYRELGRTDIFLGRWIVQDFGSYSYLPGEILLPSLIAVMARIRGVRAVYIGSAVGPLTTWLGKAVARRVLQRAVRVVTRDAESVRVAGDCVGIDTATWTAAADMAFALPRLAPDLLQQPESQEGVCLNVAPTFEQRYLPSVDPTADAARFYDAIAAFIGNHLAGGTLTFLSTAPHEDYKSHQALTQRGCAMPCLVPASTAAFFSALAGVECAVLSRFHAIVFAILAGTPFIAICYQPKVDRLMAEMAWPYTVAVNDCTADRLAELWEDLQQNADEARRQLAAHRPRLEERAMLNFLEW